MPHPKLFVALLASAIGVAACQRPPASVPTPSPTSSSIQDLMVALVDPSADAIWESVSSETSSKGNVEHQPRTAEEWLAVRRHAIILLEAATLLTVENRTVTAIGKSTEDAHVPGISTPEEIKKMIDRSRPAFDAHARALGEAAGEALAAIDARDPVRLLAAGGKIDQACERCHLAYWYPNTTRPPEKWPARIKGN
jgi:hypothetical protein